MKLTAFCLLLIIFIPFRPFAAIIVATSTGNWTASSTWNLNRTPQNEDQVIIPFGRTVYFQNTPYPKNDVPARPTLNIDVYGSLDFSNAGNDKLYLDAGSTIEIFLLGKIETSTASSEIIAIFNGTDDNTVWTGSPSQIYGPQSATGTSSGFQNALLPVKLDHFNARRFGKTGIELTWQTNEETNSSHFDVERMNGSNQWQTIGRIEAAGNTSGKKNYQFRCEAVAGLNQFRLKQVDIDGRYEHSPVRTIDVDASQLRITYARSSRTLYFEGVATAGSEISIYTINGSLVQKGKVSDTGTLLLRSDVNGIVVVAVSGNQEFGTSQKIIL